MSDLFWWSSADLLHQSLEPRPMNARSTLSFDPGIGGGDDPHLQSALAGLQQQKKAAPPPPPSAASPPATETARPAVPEVVDEYRARNPSLPSISFDDVKHLPSMGKAYPPGATVRYRPYTLGESIFAEESRMGIRETYDMILKGLECSFPAMDLTLPDVLYLGLVRKIASLGSTKVNVTTTCPYCQGLNRTPIECTALEFDDLEVPALPINAPFSFGDHTFAPLTLGRYLDLLDRKLEDDFVALMAAQCTSVDDLDFAIEMIKGMVDPDDIALIKQIDEMLHHELKPVMVTCPQEIPSDTDQGGDEPAPTCGKRYPVALDDVSAAFVLPFPGRDSSDVRRQVTFG